jgi:hypothetical protein
MPNGEFIVDPTTTENQWEIELAGLLTELSLAQGDLLDLLAEKRRLLVAADAQGLLALQSREQELVSRLQACHVQRGRLLERAAEQGLPFDSIRSLAAAMPQPGRKRLNQQVVAASARTRLLQHHSLTHWVLAQRSLIHLSQLLEIFATGGRQRTTYGKGPSPGGSGSLVDQAA